MENQGDHMKYRELAAAIRKGAKMGPQTFNTFGDGIGSCALGAIALSRGWVSGYFGVYDHLGDISMELRGEISVKNDCDNLTREQIADWLDSLEPRISDEAYTRQFIDGVMASVKSQDSATVK